MSSTIVSSISWNCQTSTFKNIWIRAFWNLVWSNFFWVTLYTWYQLCMLTMISDIMLNVYQSDIWDNGYGAVTCAVHGNYSPIRVWDHMSGWIKCVGVTGHWGTCPLGQVVVGYVSLGQVSLGQMVLGQLSLGQVTCNRIQAVDLNSPLWGLNKQEALSRKTDFCRK